MLGSGIGSRGAFSSSERAGRAGLTAMGEERSSRRKPVMSRAAFLQRGGIVRGIASVVLFLLMAAGLASIPATRLITSCSDNPSVNAVICTATEDQDSLYGAGDGSGGAVVAWQASHNLTKGIYTEEVVPSCVVNHPPAQPSNASPADGEEGVILTPTLKCSAFSDPDAGDTHYASQWRITPLPAITETRSS